MTNQEIFDLMDRFEHSSLQTLKLSMEGISIELGRGGAAPAAAVVSAPPVGETEARTNAPCIAAPLVGTYYAASAPGQTPFVRPGDRVSKGQTVCLIEAMKMMSEVPAPCDCVIKAVLKADGELVSFGEPLFHYQAV